MQSALESAQLLLLACLGAERREFRVFAINDLGWPVSLMDLALAVLARSDMAPEPRAVKLTGLEAIEDHAVGSTDLAAA